MIPLNTFTPDPELGDFLPPNNNDYYPLFQIVRGGTEIGNNSTGRDIQDWQVYYQQGIIHIKPSLADVMFTLPVNDVLSVSLAFDTDMRVVLTWTTPTGAKLYFYDTLTLDYITVNYDGVTSSRVAVDKIDAWYNSSSDVIFAYVKNNNLYYRQQRDRYDIEYLIGPANGYIKRAGLTKLNRFQIDISEVQYAQTNINVLAGIYVPINLTGPIAQIPKCVITPNSLTVNEGGVITYTLVTEYISDGTILEFKKSGGSALDSDFDTPLTGTVTIQNGSGTFSLNVKDDILVEGTETVIMSLNISGKITTLAKSPEVTIVDTTPVPTSTPSSTPVVSAATYQITPNRTAVNEGEVITFTVNTTSVSNGTVLLYYISNSNASLTATDFKIENGLMVDTSKSPLPLGYVVINNDFGTFDIKIASDINIENAEAFRVNLCPIGGGIGNAITVTNEIYISDIIPAAPTYAITSNTTTLTEGGSVATFYVNTTNVPNGTRLNFGTFNNSTGLDWYDINWSSPTSSGTVGDRQLANLVIYNNYATFTVWAVQDNIFENQESFKIQLTPFNGNTQLALSETIYVGALIIEPTVVNIGFNFSYLRKIGFGSFINMVIGILSPDNHRGAQFKIKIIPTNSVFKVSHLEWSAFNNADFNTFSPMQSINDYIYQGSSSGPGVRLTAEGLALQETNDGTFRIEILHFNTETVLASSDYYVKYV